MLAHTRSDPDFEKKLKALSSVIGKKKNVAKQSDAIEEILSGSDQSSDGDEELR